MAGMMMKVLCVMVAFMVLSAPYTEAIRCGQVISSLSPCLGYSRSGGAVSGACCSGVKRINSAARTPADRKTACGCLKSAYSLTVVSTLLMPLAFPASVVSAFLTRSVPTLTAPRSSKKHRQKTMCRNSVGNFGRKSDGKFPLESSRECKSPRNQESGPRNQDSSRKTVIVEDTSSKAMMAIDGTGFDWSYLGDDEIPTNMTLMAFSDPETIKNMIEDLLLLQAVLKEMCDKKNSVLFTKTECLILSSDFKLPDKNQVLLKFCRINGIKKEFSNARTPQQTGVAERKNRILIEAAITMLANSLLPIPFWAEAVNTACYVQNGVLVTKPHNKTPYKLLIGRPPIISFMRPFGCPVTILNTLDHLGKFDGKANERFLVGYSLNSKAFRVYNSKTKKKPLKCSNCKVFGHVPNKSPKKIISNVLNNFDNPRQATRSVLVDPNVSFKSTKQIYKPVSNKNGASSGGKKKQVKVSRLDVSNSNPFDTLNSIQNDDKLGTNEENLSSAGKRVASSSISITPIPERIDKFERQLIEGKLLFMDDDGKPLPKVFLRLCEQWKETKRDDENDSYDDDMYDSHDMSDNLPAICDELDITIRG
nr:retrovirus-related Pol polyprotein from transposon TNT 1-94 [Tanacetum cinerariifolium]